MLYTVVVVITLGPGNLLIQWYRNSPNYLCLAQYRILQHIFLPRLPTLGAKLLKGTVPNIIHNRKFMEDPG